MADKVESRCERKRERGARCPSLPVALTRACCSAAVVAAKALRKVQPLEALNPYTSAWTVRVRASGKGALRTVKTSRGDAKVFSVELTDEQARWPAPALAVSCPGPSSGADRVFPASPRSRRASPAKPPPGRRRPRSCSPRLRTTRCAEGASIAPHAFLPGLAHPHPLARRALSRSTTSPTASSSPQTAATPPPRSCTR